jgi:hypothetical protein
LAWTFFSAFVRGKAKLLPKKEAMDPRRCTGKNVMDKRGGFKKESFLKKTEV